jgi:hypothetical protein
MVGETEVTNAIAVHAHATRAWALLAQHGPSTVLEVDQSLEAAKEHALAVEGHRL